MFFDPIRHLLLWVENVVTNCNGNYDSAHKVRVFILTKILRRANAGLVLYPEMIYQTQLTLLYGNDTGQKVLRL